MAWDVTMVTMVRVLINDLDSSNYTYTDERIEQIIVVAAQLVQQQLDFDVDYTINIDTPDISPDPTVTATKDDAFTNFSVLKAACIADQGTFRTKALSEGIKAVCGPVALTVAGNLKGFQTLLDKGPCAAYEELKNDYVFGQPHIKAIFSPFVSNNFRPTGVFGNDNFLLDERYRADEL